MRDYIAMNGLITRLSRLHHLSEAFKQVPKVELIDGKIVVDISNTDETIFGEEEKEELVGIIEETLQNLWTKTGNSFEAAMRVEQRKRGID